MSRIIPSSNHNNTALKTADISLKKTTEPTKEVKQRKKSTSFSVTNKKNSKRALTPEEAASLRRIQSEWKDMVQAGMAYNWKLQKPVLPKGTDFAKPHHIWVGPLSKNLWVWHFSFMGIEGTAFEGGVYHGRLLLPKNYPGSPPKVQVFTPSGRFIPRADICLSASHFHPETWTATWTVRTLVESLRLHMLTTANEIGGMEATRKQRVTLAKASRLWKAPVPPSILVDHAAMIQSGLFPSWSANEEIEDGEKCPSCSSFALQDRVELQLRERPRGLAALFSSPIKVALLGLCLLFVILNTR